MSVRHSRETTMATSVFELFKIGIGPSSSHTVGPMVAARLFVNELMNLPEAGEVTRIKTELLGSLGATGKGHGSDKAILLGLSGEQPDTVEIDSIESRLQAIRETQRLTLPSGQELAFNEKSDLVMHRRKSLPFHPNAMSFSSFDRSGNVTLQRHCRDDDGQ